MRSVFSYYLRSSTVKSSRKELIRGLLFTGWNPVQLNNLIEYKKLKILRTL